jgi:hypothetical protein
LHNQPRRNFDDSGATNEQQKSGMTAIVGAERVSHPKLPLWRTIRLSYSSYFQHFGDVLRISVFWLATTAMLDAAMGWMQASWIAHVLANPQGRPDLTQPVEMTVLDNIGSAIVVLASVSIAVAWHRLLLLEERPGRSGGNLVTSALWLYVGAAIIICLLQAVPFLALLLAIWVFGWTPAAGRRDRTSDPLPHRRSYRRRCWRHCHPAAALPAASGLRDRRFDADDQGRLPPQPRQ